VRRAWRARGPPGASRPAVARARASCASPRSRAERRACSRRARSRSEEPLRPAERSRCLPLSPARDKLERTSVPPVSVLNGSGRKTAAGPGALDMTLTRPTRPTSPAERAVDLEPEFAGLALGVVIPAYGVAGQIERVIAGIPDYVRSIIVVEDASFDDTLARLRAVRDPRLIVLRHDKNRGVGAAM